MPTENEHEMQNFKSIDENDVSVDLSLYQKNSILNAVINSISKSESIPEESLRVDVKKRGSTEYTRKTLDILHITNDAQLKQAEKKWKSCTVTSQQQFNRNKCVPFFPGSKCQRGQGKATRQRPDSEAALTLSHN